MLGKALLLLLVFVLSMSGLASLGCIRGTQPIGWSGGIVADGTLFVGTKEGRLVAINLADGSRQWSEPLKGAASTGGFGCATAPAKVSIYGTPVVVGNSVYLGAYNGKFYAFNPSSLTEEPWIYPREGRLEPIIGNAVVAGDYVYFGCADGKVYALDAAKLALKWEFETGDKIWSTPAIDGDTLYITSFDKKIYALDAETGRETKWNKPFEAGGAIASTPLVYNETIYIGSFDRHVYAVDATDGSLRWRSEAEAGKWFWTKPVAYDGVLYAPCLDGKVYILDAEDGHEIVDAVELGSPVSSSPVLVGSSIILASQEGLIYALDTANNGLKLLTDLELKAGVYVYGPLCVNEGIVYIHSQDLTIRPVDVNTGAQLKTISLKSGE